MCTICQSDKRDLWGPSKHSIDLEIVTGGRWINLERCKVCGTYWVYSSYEPYSAFPYWVKWRYDPKFWKEIHDLEDAKLIHDWHKLEIKRLWKSLPESEREKVERHRERTYQHHNPIDMPVDSDMKLKEIITAYNKS